MKRLAPLVIFACLFGWTTNVAAQSSPNYEWEPFDGPTMGLQAGSSLLLGAGITYLGYHCLKQDVPSVGCVAGGFLANAAYLGSGVVVSLVGMGMGSEATDMDVLASTTGYLVGFGAGALAGYGLFADNEADEISAEAFAGMAASGVVLGTLGAILGYHLSADPVEASSSVSSELSVGAGAGNLGLSLRLNF